MENKSELHCETLQLQTSIENLLDPFVILMADREDAGCAEKGAIRDFIIGYANEAACQVARLPKATIVGQSLLASMPRSRDSGLFAHFCKVVNTGQPLVLDDFEYHEPRSGKQESFILEIRASALNDGLVITWRDITQRRQMEAELAEVQRRLGEYAETERRILARMLHDGPVQDLYAIDYLLHELEQHPEDTQSKRSLVQVQIMLHQVINTLLQTVGELRPMSLGPFGLKAAILSYIQRFQERHPDVDLRLNLEDDRQMLPEMVRLGLFRIFEQIMRNVEVHSDARRVLVLLKLWDQRVILVIEDDGVGFPVPPRPVTLVREGQYGLARAIIQAERLGGALKVESQPGCGTRVTVYTPLESKPGVYVPLD